MKKVLAILFAMMFMVATTGLCFAQAAPAKTPEKAAADKKDAADKVAVDKEGRCRQEGYRRRLPTRRLSIRRDAADKKATDKKKTAKKTAADKKATARRPLPTRRMPTRRQLPTRRMPTRRSCRQEGRREEVSIWLRYTSQFERRGNGKPVPFSFLLLSVFAFHRLIFPNLSFSSDFL